MSKSILIEGLPASGKTVSLRNLPPKETFWINADGKFGAWKGFDKWSDIGQFGFDIVDAANNMRDDLVVILVGHTSVNDEGYENLVVNGRKLEKIQLPAYISVVILARHEDDKYKYVLRGDGCSARVPFGYFDGVDEIDNDIMLVLQELEWIKKPVDKTDKV